MKNNFKKPAIGQVGFNLYDGFVLEPDAEHILDESHFDEDYEIKCWGTSFSRISILD